MRRMSFRTRLVIIIAGVFIAAGAALLTVQYLVVQSLFASAINTTAATCVPSLSVTQVAPGTPATDGTDISGVAPLTDGSGLLYGTSSTGCAYFAETADAADFQVATPMQTVAIDAVEGAVLQQSTFLADEVGSGLLLWSIVVLVAFTGVAAAIAFWLARRSLDRIGEVTAAARDISERDLGRRLDLPGPDDEIKELGDTIDGMLDRLQSAFTAQDRFVANASHELRTPLTTTRTALEIPLEQGAVPVDLQANMQRALRATEQSERLITALLALARARTGLDEVEPVELSELIEDQVEELDAQEIAVHTNLRELTVEGDTVLLARAVRNLLENGIRHNAPGGELWVRCRRERGRAIIEVENTGATISPATVELLTEPFYRGDASRTSTGPDGTGLGLAIVQSIAKTHGGEVRLRARKGGGLIAAIVLPL
ncbi:two-component sensor histidine kinase [Microbacterium sp. MYb54]|nr:two-component sensor histidine kinase [Microbacterium sp. MYb43]PQZ80960.1 two-component sensor histidine kinase [Microbacterium sp. MYb40]PRB20792.1 two-component sensor histidine kinase [Microbacterium sp. MYb54]PRB31853.1 two-component sensor histidine kinase [Microbacterium sp. MYb50]PRB64531.1 two-component sensor histidine kinase [Microbacterium sp. MYb24]PRB77595.1 two-component sensor histidine kinase [Microbacterium sp. MYb32]